MSLIERRGLCGFPLVLTGKAIRLSILLRREGESAFGFSQREIDLYIVGHLFIEILLVQGASSLIIRCWLDPVPHRIVDWYEAVVKSVVLRIERIEFDGDL